MERGRILNRKLFLYLLNLEVKRAIRYQNFFSILKLKWCRLPGYENGKGLQTCYQNLNCLLIEELRESDILGSLEDDQLAILLPYADLSDCGPFRSRLEGLLKYYEFKEKGYEVMTDLICFPTDGTDPTNLIRKL